MSSTAATLPGVSGDGMVNVKLPSGATFPVYVEEVDYIQERAKLYMSQNHFVQVSDHQDVDRMLILELFVYRWGVWLSRGRDWWGDPIDDDKTQKSINAWSTELRQLKKQLGLDKATRDKERGDDSVGAYIESLQIRAREFGVMREDQLAKALELFNQLHSLVTLWENSDEIERREMHVTIEDVMEWLTTIAFPEYDAIDLYFRTHTQSAWIRRQ
jgi:hypothetical protein